jgi:hypothetical protein
MKTRRMALVVIIVFVLPLLVTNVFAQQVKNDAILSQYIKEADGSSGQNANAGSGIKTGHIQDGAVIDAKITGPISSAKIQRPANLIVVAKSGGDFSDPAAAVNSIIGASATTPYLVKIMPGVYTVTSPIQMKSFVDIEGSGQENTIITSTIAHDDLVCIYDYPGPERATVVMAANAKISNIRVENKSNLGGIAILIRQPSSQVENVTAEASGTGDDCARGCFDYTAISVNGPAATGIVLKNVKAIARKLNPTDCNNPRAIMLVNGSETTVLNSMATASGGGTWARGIAIWDGADLLTTAAIRDCVFEASNPRPDGGTAAAIYGFATNATVDGTKAFVHDSEYCAAIDSVTTVMHSEARVANCTVESFGIVYTAKVASTLIENGNVPNALQSLDKVVNCWDENFDPIPNK